MRQLFRIALQLGLAACCAAGAAGAAGAADECRRLWTEEWVEKLKGTDLLIATPSESMKLGDLHYEIISYEYSTHVGMDKARGVFLWVEVLVHNSGPSSLTIYDPDLVRPCYRDRLAFQQIDKVDVVSEKRQMLRWLEDVGPGMEKVGWVVYDVPERDTYFLAVYGPFRRSNAKLMIPCGYDRPQPRHAPGYVCRVAEETIFASSPGYGPEASPFEEKKPSERKPLLPGLWVKVLANDQLREPPTVVCYVEVRTSEGVLVGYGWVDQRRLVPMPGTESGA